MNNKTGGLGIRDLAILNEVLLEMWSWRYASEMEPIEK